LPDTNEKKLTLTDIAQPGFFIGVNYFYGKK